MFTCREFCCDHRIFFSFPVSTFSTLEFRIFLCPPNAQPYSSHRQTFPYPLRSSCIPDSSPCEGPPLTTQSISSLPVRLQLKMESESPLFSTPGHTPITGQVNSLWCLTLTKGEKAGNPFAGEAGSRAPRHSLFGTGDESARASTKPVSPAEALAQTCPHCPGHPQMPLGMLPQMFREERQLPGKTEE